MVKDNDELEKKLSFLFTDDEKDAEKEMNAEQQEPETEQETEPEPEPVSESEPESEEDIFPKGEDMVEKNGSIELIFDKKGFGIKTEGIKAQVLPGCAVETHGLKITFREGSVFIDV